uniref:Tub domain-containing protein n=1 Tax=Rhabditophanes sp. KR3021 TaxID=114890 RepID=A0AC35TNY1_9BILA
MHIFWESSNWPGAHIEPGITCLAWCPSLVDGKGEQGLLAAGSESGSVGITYTHLVKDEDDLKRYNFNLRGHHAPVMIMAWNKSHSKVTSCDTNGIIYVWIWVVADERWSVELVNDRGVKVRDICWAPNGNAALIIYEDNFVLIGSATGGREWSNIFNVGIRCGSWAPDSRELVLGLESGSIHVLSYQGGTVTERQICPGIPIKKIAFSNVRAIDNKWTIAILLDTDKIYFITAYDDIYPLKFKGSDPVIDMVWNSSGTHLAVTCQNNKFYILNHTGQVLYSKKIIMPYRKPILGLGRNHHFNHLTEDPKEEKKVSPITAITWAHDDNVIIIGCGGSLAVGKVWPSVPSLTQIVTYDVWKLLGRSSNKAKDLALPAYTKHAITAFDHHIIQCRIPSPAELREVVCSSTNYRWFCTIIPMPKKPHNFMLCIEHLSGIVPLLSAKQVNRLIPQFVISLPGLPKNKQNEENSINSKNHEISHKSHGLIGPNTNSFNNSNAQSNFTNTVIPTSLVNGCSAQVKDLSGFTKDTLRNSVWRKSKRQIRALLHKHMPYNHRSKLYSHRENEYASFTGTPFDQDFSSKITSSQILLQVSSNVWCTKFKITAPPGSYMAQKLPRFLAQVFYKTSVLHLQPRQMTIHLTDLSTCTNTNNIDSLINEESITDVSDPPSNHSLGSAQVDEVILESDDLVKDFELLPSEIEMHTKIIKEYRQLLIAIERHVLKLKDMAKNLRNNSSNLPERPSSADQIRFLHKQDDLRNDSISLKGADAESWQSQVDSLNFIDGDEDEDNTPLITKSMSVVLPLPSHPQTLNVKKLNEVNLLKFKLRELLIVKAENAELFSDECATKENWNFENTMKEIELIAEKTEYISNLLKNMPVDFKKIEEDLQQRIFYLNELFENRAERICRSNESTDASKAPSKLTILKDSLKDIGNSILSSADSNYRPLNEGEAGPAEEDCKLQINPSILVMTNKTPFWNENSQVYQLDFAGRVTQESAKNFQIEYKDKQVMQFGRIEHAAYTLDFSAPFSATQAFAIALASITQRLK